MMCLAVASTLASSMPPMVSSTATPVYVIPNPFSLFFSFLHIEGITGHISGDKVTHSELGKFLSHLVPYVEISRDGRLAYRKSILLGESRAFGLPRAGQAWKKVARMIFHQVRHY